MPRIVTLTTPALNYYVLYKKKLPTTNKYYITGIAKGNQGYYTFFNWGHVYQAGGFKAEYGSCAQCYQLMTQKVREKLKSGYLVVSQLSQYSYVGHSRAPEVALIMNARPLVLPTETGVDIQATPQRTPPGAYTREDGYPSATSVFVVFAADTMTEIPTGPNALQFFQFPYRSSWTGKPGTWYDWETYPELPVVIGPSPLPYYRLECQPTSLQLEAMYREFLAQVLTGT